MNLHRLAASPGPIATSVVDPLDQTHDEGGSTIGSSTSASSKRAGAGARSPDSGRARKVRLLIESQRYFGLDARTFHTGAKRVYARMSAQGQDKVRVDAASMIEDFSLDPVANEVLLRGLVAAGLLNPDGASGYRPTERFREYALAPLVAPLSREAARMMVGGAKRIAWQINATWADNPHLIETLAVSGSFMSRCDPLSELTLWIVLGTRAQAPARRAMPRPAEAIAVRQIAAALRAPNPFISVRVAKGRNDLPRPFIVAFEAQDHAPDLPASAWEKLRRWSASLNRRLAVG